jgi:diguanylate cyclase (GGDEF)-like protein/PAS domain S-box-containing protein
MTPWRERIARALASLKLRITLAGVLALAAGIGLATVLMVRHAERDTLMAQRELELGEATRMAGLLSHRVVELQRALQAAAPVLTTEALADPARLAALLEGMPVLRGMFSNVFVAGADGQMKVYFDAAGMRWPALNLFDRGYFRRTVAEGRPIVSEPVPGRVSGEPVIIFTYPLRDASGVYGVVGGALRLASRDLLADMVDNADADQGSLLVVTDAQGRVLAHPTRGQLLLPLSGEPRLAQAFSAWAAAGSSVEPSGLHLPQKDEVVSAAGVAGPDWMVWRARPESELLAPLRAARTEGLAWAAGLTALLSVLMLLFMGWLLRPLAQLEHRAQHLFDGQLDVHEGWPDGGGEIGRLARVLRHVGAERTQLEAFNNQVLKKLESVMSAAPVGIAFTRAQRFELVSAEFCRLLGHGESQLLGQSAAMIYSSNEDYLALGPQVITAFKAGQPYVGEWQMLRADGQRFWALLRGRPVDAEDTNAGTIWSVNDITEEVAARERLEWSATHDPLTGLANRKVLQQRLARVFDSRPLSLPAEVVMIDLDHFKPINDQAGHAAGDAMLKAVAAAVTARVRASDLVVRLGGDEFALLLERCTHDVALRVADNVRRAIAEIALPWEGRSLRVGSSLGVATLTAETASVEAWLAAADAACYEAKAAGRDTVRAAARPALRVVGA